jgi:hypothetical protein
MLEEKIARSIQGSLIELNQGEVPNFERRSPVWLEQYLNDSIQLYPVEANYPAIASEDSAWLLEPSGTNLVNYNIDLSQTSWVKGSNVIVFPDEVPAPDASTYMADRVVWSSGDGLTQILKRSFSLEAGYTYTMSLILMLTGGQLAGDRDVIRLVGGVEGSSTIKLSQLNNYSNRYRLISLQFKVAGKQLVLPTASAGGYSHDTGYTVTAVSANTITTTISGTIVADQFKGGQVQFGTNTKVYPILSSSPNAANGSVTVTIDASTLIVDGVTVGTVARFLGAQNQPVDLEFYVESTLSLNFGGIQIEKSPFRTSMIYQDADLKVRAISRLVYRNNPIAKLKSFGIFINLKEWRGDGNIADFGTLNLSIVSNRLVVKAQNATLSTDLVLPASVKIFLQVTEENNSISLFINKTLVAKTNLLGYVGDHHANFTLTSEGVRSWKSFIVFDKVLLDGNPETGGIASQEVAYLFDTEAIISARAISAPPPLIVLPPVLIPSKPAPIARSLIVGLNSATNTITVADGTNFPLNAPVSVMREDRFILRSRIQTRTPATGTQFNLGLDLTAGVLVGDFLVYGNIDQPGRASVRFPFTPIDQQKILEVDPTLLRIKLGSTLAFNRGRGFVQNIFYQDISEVLVLDKQDNLGYLYLDKVTNLEIGHVFSQAEDEMLVSPRCYLPTLLNPVDNVAIANCYENGLVIENLNPFPVQVQPAIRVYY